METNTFLNNSWDLEEEKAKSHKTNINNFDDALISETNKYLADYIDKKGYKRPKEQVS